MMKSNMMTIIKKEFARFFGDKRMVFSTILMPGIMIYVLYTLMGSFMTQQLTSEDGFVAECYVQDMPAELAPMLEQLPAEWQSVSASDVAGIQTELNAKEADLLVVFPENFTEQMGAYDVTSGAAAPNVEIYYNSSKPESADIRSMLVSLLSDYEASITNKFDVNAGTVKYDCASEKDMTGQIFAMMLPMVSPRSAPTALR